MSALPQEYEKKVPILLKLKTRSTAMPFVASERVEPEARFWNVPMTGGVLGGIETGEALEALARKPLVAGALTLMRGPAHAIGLGELHDFLERGFTTFKRMGRATEFLERIEAKESELLESWLKGETPVLG